MKRIRNILFIIVSMILCVILASNISAYTVYSGLEVHNNASLMSSSSYVYLISYKNNDASVIRYSDIAKARSLSLQFPITSYSLSGDTAVFLCCDTFNRQAFVYTYDFQNDILDSFIIRNMLPQNGSSFVLVSSKLYIVDPSDTMKINRYDSSGRYEFSYSFNNDVKLIFDNKSGSVYAASGEDLFLLGERNLTTVSDVWLSSSAASIGYNTVMDNSGKVYETNSVSGRYLFRADSDNLLAGQCSDKYFLVKNNSIYRYDKSGKITGSYNFGKTIYDICALNDRLYIFSSGSDNAVYVIENSEFTDIQPETYIDTPASSNASYYSSSDSDNDSIASTTQSISSDYYDIDLQNYRISDIPPKTTVAEFRSAVNHSGYYVRIYRNDYEVKSGNIGTGMTAVFSNSSGSISFALCIPGDVTGEGNINTRDRNNLADYILGLWSFTGVYLDAADMNRDGLVDIRDIVAVQRYGR